MRTLRNLALLLGLGTTLCWSEEKKMPQARWIEVTATSRKFLIVRIADDKHQPAGEFEGSSALGKPGMTLFYILVPHGGAATEIKQVSDGRTTALAQPRMINRMPGSALYTTFLADPVKPGSLAFTVEGKKETVPLHAQASQALSWFWSGEHASIAFEEVPGWMEGSGP